METPITGLSDEAIAEKLRMAGLRPTRQRLCIGRVLWQGGHRHLTAEAVHNDCYALGEKISLATVYNTLHQLRDAGLLREVNVDGKSVFCDTNTAPHHHFYNEETGELHDIPQEVLSIGHIPLPPLGTEVSGVEVIIRVRPAVSGSGP